MLSYRCDSGGHSVEKFKRKKAARRVLLTRAAYLFHLKLNASIIPLIAEYFDQALIRFVYGGNYTKFLFKIKMF